MELYLDTANVAEVERLARIFPIAGVTTNPSIIAASKESIWEVLPRLQKAIGDEGILFAQTMSRDAQGMVKEAKRLRDAIPGIVVKIPVTSEGLAAIKMLKKEGITTLGTAVYSAAQGLLAALAGAKYVAPYVNRVDAQGGDGIRTVQELQALLEMHAPESMVLAASFKTPRQALDCLLAGCESITLPLDVAQQMLNTPAVESAMRSSSTTGMPHLALLISKGVIMDRIIQSPGKYIQGADVINRLGEYLKPLAERWLVVGDKFVLGFAQSTVEKSFKDAGLVVEIAPFGGECSQNEIDRLRGIAETAQCGAILGIGGGKTLDTAKALAHFMGVPVAIAPTIASTDAPCSALSVIYTDEGEFDRYLLLPNNPNMVIVDTKIVAGAPARLLAAGIGDALATWFEARACSRSGATTMAGGKCTQAALALAELCYNTLLEEGEKAMLAAEQHVVTPALERVIEANTYLSGVGFESGGLAAAHAVHNGLTAIPDAHHYYHGEKVAFGTLTQLVLENAPVEEIETVAALSHAVGLPITLAQLDIKEDVPAKMRIVAEAACAEGETIHNMPGGATPDQVYAALLVADQYGQRFLQEWE